jgi:hypothetical protein
MNPRSFLHLSPDAEVGFIVKPVSLERNTSWFLPVLYSAEFEEFDNSYLN